MHYEINISLHGQHFFATNERSLRSIVDVDRVYTELAEIFTEDRGFKISVTRWETSGRHIDMKRGIEVQS